jgi:hypothetical protein
MDRDTPEVKFDSSISIPMIMPMAQVPLPPAPKGEMEEKAGEKAEAKAFDKLLELVLEATPV